MTDTTDTPLSEAEAFARTLATQFRPSTNIDGWTGARQKRFLEAIAEGETVREACGQVFLSPQSAYAFRRRPNGRTFDLGWKAADLIARERVAADLLARAVDGQEVTITRADGSIVTRHQHDNRLALRMLDRLDRYADASDRTAPGHAARLIAGDFDSYLDLVGVEAGPARAGLFMLGRSDGAEATELEPIAALARADRLLRCGTLAADVDVSDLDPARRADWTADQWRRAEACGLVALAPDPVAPPTPPESQQVSTPALDADADPLDEHVWFDPAERRWLTDLVAPIDFADHETGCEADGDYARALTADEMAMLCLPIPDPEAEQAEREAERDRWFARCAAWLAQAAGAAEPAATACDDAEALAREDA